MPKDFLDEIIEERTRRNPEFPRLMDEAIFRRKNARKLSAQRQKAGLSQTVVAARMGTSASVVSKLEDGADVKISTLIRYCEAIGQPWSYNPRRR
jgi:ribosome-binding protein aMBF1 (putative translation factor)